MNSTSLTKPVDLQGLSLALAKTKTDYEGKLSYIQNNIPQSDWNENDNTQKDYIWHKPAIVAGEGENAVMIGQIEQDEDARAYNISFDYPTETTDTITFTTSDDLSDIANLSASNKEYLRCRLEYDYAINNNTYYTDLFFDVVDIDVANSTITLGSKLSYINTYTYSSVTGEIYYKYKTAYGSSSVAEGIETIAGKDSSHAEGHATTAAKKGSHSEGWLSVAFGLYSHAEGSRTKATSSGSHSEGVSTKATGLGSHAENYHTESSGMYSHSEGSYTIASGRNSHSENVGSIASGEASHAEGKYAQATITLIGDAGALTYTIADGTELFAYDANFVIGGKVSTINNAFSGKLITNATIENNIITSLTLEETLDGSNAVSKQYYILIPNRAVGIASHAEGYASYAVGNGSHSEGMACYTPGSYSHAEGNSNIASGQYQHVQGKYNIADTNNTYADIVGNGTSDDARSNAYTLDWNGNGWYAGKVTVGTAPTENMDVATKQYVDNATAGITTNLSGLTDTTITSPTDGQVLTYDATASKWVNADGGGDAITYTISATNNTITLTGSDSSTSTATLPVYDGAVTDVWEGGSY